MNTTHRIMYTILWIPDVTQIMCPSVMYDVNYKWSGKGLSTVTSLIVPIQGDSHAAVSHVYSKPVSAVCGLTPVAYTVRYPAKFC